MQLTDQREVDVRVVALAGVLPPIPHTILVPTLVMLIGPRAILLTRRPVRPRREPHYRRRWPATSPAMLKIS